MNVRYFLIILSLFILSPLFAEEKPANQAADKIPLPAKEKLHLYLLIGQSNMAGRGVIEAQDKEAHPRVLKFTKENTWAAGLAPLHFDKPIAGVGLGTSFAKAMSEADPEIVIGLIPCAVGGTPLSRWQKEGDLYRQAVVRTKAALQDGTLKGVLWHQGENDAGAEETAKNYASRLSAMIGDLRKELGAGDVPFVMGELGEFLQRESKAGRPNYWPVVNEQLHTIPKTVAKTAVVSSTGLKHKGDVVHFDSAGLREFGQRYAAAMKELQGK